MIKRFLNIFLIATLILGQLAPAWAYTPQSFSKNYPVVGLEVSGNSYSLFADRQALSGQYSFSPQELFQVFETFLRLPPALLGVNLSPGYPTLPNELLNTLVGRVLLQMDLMFKSDLERSLLRHLVASDIDRIEDFPYFWIEPRRAVIGRDKDGRAFVKDIRISVKVKTKDKKARELYRQVCKEMEDYIYSSKDYRPLILLFELFALADYLKRDLASGSDSNKGKKDRARRNRGKIIKGIEVVPDYIYSPQLFFSVYDIKRDYARRFFSSYNTSFRGRKVLVSFGGVKFKKMFRFVRKASFPEGLVSIIKDFPIRITSKRPDFSPIPKDIRPSVEEALSGISRERYWQLLEFDDGGLTGQWQGLFYLPSRNLAVHLKGERGRHGARIERKEGEIVSFKKMADLALISSLTKEDRFSIFHSVARTEADVFSRKGVITDLDAIFFPFDFDTSMEEETVLFDDFIIARPTNGREYFYALNILYKDICIRLGISPRKKDYARAFFGKAYPYSQDDKFGLEYANMVYSEYQVVLGPYDGKDDQKKSNGLFYRVRKGINRINAFLLEHLGVVLMIGLPFIFKPLAMPIFLLGIKSKKLRKLKARKKKKASKGLEEQGQDLLESILKGARPENESMDRLSIDRTIPRTMHIKRSYSPHDFLSVKGLAHLKSMLRSVKDLSDDISLWYSSGLLDRDGIARHFGEKAFKDSEFFSLYSSRVLLPILQFTVTSSNVSQMEKTAVAKSVLITISSFDEKALLSENSLTGLKAALGICGIAINTLANSSDELPSDYIAETLASVIGKVYRVSSTFGKDELKLKAIFISFEFCFDYLNSIDNLKNKRIIIEKIIRLLKLNIDVDEILKDKSPFMALASRIISSRQVAELYEPSDENIYFFIRALNPHLDYPSDALKARLKILCEGSDIEKQNARLVLSILIDYLMAMSPYSQEASNRFDRLVDNLLNFRLDGRSQRDKLLAYLLYDSSELSVESRIELIARFLKRRLDLYYLGEDILYPGYAYDYLSKDTLSEFISQEKDKRLRYAALTVFWAHREFKEFTILSRPFLDDDNWILPRFMLALEELDNEDNGNRLRLFLADYPKEEIIKRLYSAVDIENDPRTSIIALSELAYLVQNLDKLFPYLEKLSKAMPLKDSEEYYCFYLFYALMHRLYSDLWVEKEIMSRLSTILQSMDMRLHLSTIAVGNLLKPYNEISSLQWFLDYVSNKKDLKDKDKIPGSLLEYLQYKRGLLSGLLPELPQKARFETDAEKAAYYLISAEKKLLSMPDSSKEWESISSILKKAKKNNAELETALKLKIDTIKALADIKQKDVEAWNDELNELALRLSAFILKDTSVDDWVDFKDRLLETCSDRFKNDKYIIYDSNLLSYALLMLAEAESAIGNYEEALETLAVLSMRNDLNPRFSLMLLATASAWVVDLKTKVLMDKIITNLNAEQLLARYMNDYLKEAADKNLSKKYIQKRLPLKYKPLFYTLKNLSSIRAYREGIVLNTLRFYFANKEKSNLDLPALGSLAESVKALSRREEEDRKELRPLIKALDKFVKRLAWAEGGIPSSIKSFLDTAAVSYSLAKERIPGFSREWFILWDKAIGDDRARIRIDFYRGKELIDSFRLADGFPLAILAYYEDRLKGSADRIEVYPEDLVSVGGIRSSVDIAWAREFLNNLDRYISMWAESLSDSAEVEIDKLFWDAVNKEAKVPARSAVFEEKIGYLPGNVSLDKFPMAAYLVRVGWLRLGDGNRLLASDALISLSDAHKNIRDYLLSCLASYGYNFSGQDISSDRFVLVPGKLKRTTVNYVLWLGQGSDGQWIVKGVYNRSKREEFGIPSIPKKKRENNKGNNSSPPNLQWPESTVYNSSCYIPLKSQDVYFSLPFRPKNRPQNKSLVFANWAKTVEKRSLLFSYFIKGNRLFYTILDPINYAFMCYNTTIDNAIASAGHFMTLALKDKDRAVFYPSYQWWVEKHQLSLPVSSNNLSIINAPGIRFMGRDEKLYDSFDVYLKEYEAQINGEKFYFRPERWIVHSLSSPDGWHYYIYEVEKKPIKSYLIQKGIDVIDSLPLAMHLYVSRQRRSYLEFYKGGRVVSRIDSDISLPVDKTSVSLNNLFPSMNLLPPKFKEIHYPNQKSQNTEALFYIGSYVISIPPWFSYRGERLSDLVRQKKLFISVKEYKPGLIRATLSYYDNTERENVPLLDFSIKEKDGMVTLQSILSYDKDIFLEGASIKTTRSRKTHRLSFIDLLGPHSSSVLSRHRLTIDKKSKYFSIGSGITISASDYLKRAIDSGIWKVYIETINGGNKEHKMLFYNRRQSIELGFILGRIFFARPQYSVRFLVDTKDKEHADVCWNGICKRIDRRENLYLANYMEESLYDSLKGIKKIDARQKIYSFDLGKGVYLNIKTSETLWKTWLAKLVSFSSDNIYLWQDRHNKKIYLVSKKLNLMTPILQYRFKVKEDKIYIKLPLSKRKEISKDLSKAPEITLSLDSLLSENRLDHIKENNGILSRLEYISALRLFIMIRHILRDKDIASILEDERKIYGIIIRFLNRRYSDSTANVFVIYMPAVRNWFEVENINKKAKEDLSSYIQQVLDKDPDALEYVFSKLKTSDFVTFIKKDEGTVLFPFIYFMFNLVPKDKIKGVLRYNIQKHHEQDPEAYLSKIDKLLKYFSENDDLLDKYGFIYYFLQRIRPFVARVTEDLSYELKNNNGNTTLAAVSILPMVITMKQLGIPLMFVLTSVLPVVFGSIATLAIAAQIFRTIRNRKGMEFYPVEDYGFTLVLEEKYNIPYTIALKIAGFLYRLSLIYPDTTGQVRSIIEKNRRFEDFAEDLAIYLLSNTGQAGKTIRDKILLTPASKVSSSFRERLAGLRFRKKFAPMDVYSVLKHSDLLGWISAYSGIEITYDDLIGKSSFDFSMDKGSRLLFDMFSFDPEDGLKTLNLPGFTRQFLHRLLAKKGRQFTRKVVIALEYLKELSYIYPEIRDSVLSAYGVFSSRFYPWIRPPQPKERSLLPYGGIVLTKGERLWEK